MNVSAQHSRTENMRIGAARVGIGFGIDTPAQVKAVLALADYAIVGSALIREKEKGGLDHYLEYLKNAIRPATLAN